MTENYSIENLHDECWVLLLTITKAFLLLIVLPLAFFTERLAQLSAWLVRYVEDYQPIVPSVFEREK
jgi:hypothetical protein